MIVPSISYVSIFVLIACMTFFAKAAELEGRSKLLWGGLSLVMWLGFTHFFVRGIGGGLVSQIVLFVGWAALGLLGEWKASKRRPH